MCRKALRHGFNEFFDGSSYKAVNYFLILPVAPAQGVAGNSGSLLPACGTVFACKRKRALQGGSMPYAELVSAVLLVR